VTRAETSADVVPAVEEALDGAYQDGLATAVLIAQRVLGVKRFTEGAR
jgi:hypothetical protein